MKAYIYMFFCLILFYGLYTQAAQEADASDTINIHDAAKRANIEAVRAFVNGSQTINELDSGDNTPLHLACDYAGNQTRTDRHQICREVISMLIRAGADLSATNNRGQTPLYLFIKLVVKNMAPLSSVEEMVGMGADVTAVNDSGNTLLHSIFIGTGDANGPPHRGRPNSQRFKEVIDYLVQLGVDINAENHAGEVPLDLASRYSAVSVVSHLIEKGANVEMATRSLHNAVFARSFSVTYRLLEAGADVHGVNDRNRTPLHLAIDDNSEYDNNVHLAIVFLLMQHGADIHAEDHRGWTPYLQMVERTRNTTGARKQYEMFMDFLEWWPTQPQLLDEEQAIEIIESMITER